MTITTLVKKNKIGKLKFNNINNLINTKKKINELNEIKTVEIKSKTLIENQKKLLSLFDDLKTVFNVNKNERVNVNENENESVNENDNDNENENESVNESENESENKNENENENEREDGQYYLEQINNSFKEIYETKSFEDQINIFYKIPDIGDYWDINYY